MAMRRGELHGIVIMVMSIMSLRLVLFVTCSFCYSSVAASSGSSSDNFNFRGGTVASKAVFELGIQCCRCSCHYTVVDANRN